MPMKNYKLTILFILFSTSINAQVNWNIGDRVKKKVEERIDRGIDQTIDKGINEAEEGVKEGAKPDEKKEAPKPATKPSPNAQSGDSQSPNDDNNPTEGTKANNPPLQVYSKFDFLQGAKIIAFEDFSQDAIGDFPARWNTNGTAEVVNLSTQKGNWLKIDNVSYVSFIPDDFTNFPENFTLEFDLVYNNWQQEYAYARRIIASFFNAEKTSDGMGEKAAGSGFAFEFDGNMGLGSTRITNIDNEGRDGEINSAKDIASINPDNNGKVFHISIWRQKTRVRVYLDETKLFDLPRIIEPNTNLNTFKIFASLSDENKPVFLSNFRLAVGSPDTRNKLITEGKFSTTGILFDVNSDKIKGESYGILKDIANTLIENPTVKVKIIGHTDSDGDAAKNLELSKKRAEAVKQALIKEFNIDASRLVTDGKGAAEPVNPNNTPQGKASNRRVEFIKL
jgi:outer membrane protein OmpA-like peptidoglycan-associated protein